jgi:hypothetical protein
MKKIDLEKLTKERRFPAIRPLVQPNPKSWLSRIRLFFTFRRKFEIVEDYVVWSEYLQKFVFIPKGFVFDGASVPKVLNSIYQSTGMLFYGASVHDHGYRYMCLVHVNKGTGELYVKHYPKSELDEIFRHLCAEESGLSTASGVATFGLTLFGFTGWGEARKNGKILSKDFPELF